MTDKPKTKTLATAKTVERIEQYVNEYFYSTAYRVNPETLDIIPPPTVNLPEPYFVCQWRGGFRFAVRV